MMINPIQTNKLSANQSPNFGNKLPMQNIELTMKNLLGNGQDDFIKRGITVLKRDLGSELQKKGWLQDRINLEYEMLMPKWKKTLEEQFQNLSTYFK